MSDRSTTMSEKIRHIGYDQEEEYFFKKNQEAIEALRAARARENEQRDGSAAPVPRSTMALIEALRELIAGVTKPLPTGIGQFPV